MHSLLHPRRAVPSRLKERRQEREAVAILYGGRRSIEVAPRSTPKTGGTPQTSTPPQTFDTGLRGGGLNLPGRTDGDFRG